MYSLLIVDDEKETREGLSKLIPWEDMGFELIGKLEDGRDAIDYLRKDPVHAILSDIKMSFESGLKVAQFVYEHKLQTKVVLLSGYQEFSLAHEAIKYEVKHYLLKPSDLQEIQDTFQKLKVELDHEQQVMKGVTPVESKVETNDASTWNVIDEAKKYIEQECHRDISLTEVAERVYLSPVYFSRLFKELTDENYSEYLTRTRIRKAEALLKETHYRIYEICDQVGPFIRLISNYKFNSILLRNFLIIILLLFLPLGGFSAYVYVFNKNVVEDEIAQANLINVTQVKDMVDSIFTEMNGFSLRMLSDKSVEDIVNSQIPSPYEYTDLVSLKDLQNNMSVIELTNMFIDSIYIFFENQNYFLSSGEGRRVNQPSPEWWYEGYSQSDSDDKTWLYSDSGKLKYISFYRRFSDVASEPKGFVMVNLNIQKLVDMMTSTFRQSQNVYIVNESGEVLYNQDPATLGLAFSQIEPEIFKDLNSDLYSEVVSMEGQERVTSIAASRFAGWKYVSIIPLEEYQEKISEFNQLSVIFFVFSAVSALVLAFIISVKNYQPIMRIIKWIENRDDDLLLQKQSDSARLDEIRFIAANIAQSQHEREELFEELAEKYKLLRKAQAIALQSQIHPHFLFNTLETINWKVMKLTNSNNEASDMIRDLSKLLRYSLNTEEELITIKKEMEFVRIYLDIQKVRYEDKMDVRWKLPHDIGHYRILKLLIQPIVENAIYHGIKPSRNPGIITITGSLKSDALIIQIRDNGVGMKQSMVEKINTSFYKSEEEIRENMHIGLTNVNHRIQLMFGRRYGLTVRSENGRGTVVEMFIPKIERKHE